MNINVVVLLIVLQVFVIVNTATVSALRGAPAATVVAFNIKKTAVIVSSTKSLTITKI